MKQMKKWFALGGVGILTLFLSACHRAGTTTQMKPPTGFFGLLYKWIGVPLQQLMEWIANFFGDKVNGYGIAIIIITLVVRLILLPLMLRQQKKMTESQEKMKVLKPQIDLIQAQLKKTKSQPEQVRLNQMMQDVYRKNGTSMLPSMGCLTLIIQLPIFSGLYQAVAYSPEISKSTFFGIPLGHSSLIIAFVATGFYFLQSWIMLQGVDPSQRKTMQTSAIMSPMITFFFCLMYNAGLGLYFLAGGIIIVIQQLIVTYIITPSIRKRMDEDIKENPPVVVVDEHTFDQPLVPEAPAAPSGAGQPATTTTTSAKRNRNAGKQQHHHSNE